MVVCSEDHSLLRRDGTTVSPNGVNIGDALLHYDDALLLTEFSTLRHSTMTGCDAFEDGVHDAEITSDLLCSPTHVVKAFLEGVGINATTFYSKKRAAGLFVLATL